ncbi:hypothetical protein HanLR1_Chr10g0352111 [Helianthus annuus]|nr:hypothetical protein HanLR1_Chr10g0352111 [Helianthus annuus]
MVIRTESNRCWWLRRNVPHILFHGIYIYLDKPKYIKNHGSFTTLIWRKPTWSFHEIRRFQNTLRVPSLPDLENCPRYPDFMPRNIHPCLLPTIKSPISLKS